MKTVQKYFRKHLLTTAGVIALVLCAGAISRSSSTSNASTTVSAQASDLQNLGGATSTSIAAAPTPTPTPVGAGLAPNGDPGDFEIDGEVVADAGGGHTDWVSNGTGTTGLVNSTTGDPLDGTVTFHVRDNYSTNDDAFSTSAKVNDNPNGYTWLTGSSNNKTDMNNVYAHISIDTVGDRWITASADRLSSNGTAYVDFELNQAKVSKVTNNNCSLSQQPCGVFVTDPLNASTGGRTPNDLLVTANYGSGGAVATMLISQWKQPSAGAAYQWVDVTPTVTSKLNTCGPSGNQPCAYVATNATQIPVPYGAFGQTVYNAPTSGGTISNQFVEMSVDLTKLVNAIFAPCQGIQIQTIFVKTKTSVSSTAQLMDFAAPIAVSFNTTPGVFNVTGGGTYCPNGNGVPVGLDGSQVGVNYQLQLNGSNIGSPVMGTGSPISFGNQTAAGTYTVVAINASSGCNINMNGSAVVAVDQPISASETTTPASCNGGSDGSVTVTVSGGTSPYSVTVNGVTHTGVTSSTQFTGLAASSSGYPASITDKIGCPGSATGVPVGQPSGITASETTTPASCFNGTDGTVTVTVSGGTSPYSVTVNGVTHTGVTSSTTFTGLAAGSYSASISDKNGCPGTAAGVPVGQPTAISASETTTPASCFNGTDGTVTVSVSGGTSPYSVTINGVTHTGVTSSTTFTGLAAGSYSASISDKNGCPGTAAGVPVGQPTAISASETTTPASCFNGTDGTVTVSVSGGTSPYSVTVNGVTHTGVTSSTTFTGLAAGSYSASISDKNGCPGTAAGVPVGQPTAISASETTTPASCFNGTDGTVTVSVSGGTSPYSVTINGVTHTGVTSSTTFTGLAAGSYSASISDKNGCPGTAAGVPVGQPTAISASETTTPASCFNGTDGTVTVSVSGGTSPYSVTVNGVTHTGVTSSTTFTGLAAGSYSASISDKNGCPGSAAGVPVGQPSGITASETTTPASCFNGTDGTVTVTVSGGTSPYSVTVNGVTHTGVTSSTTFTGLAAGNYSASISDKNGCPGTAAGVPVGQPTAISASETTTPASCFNGTDGTVTVSVSGGTSPYSVTINGVTHTGVTSSTTFTGLAAGSYSASISDKNGCPGSAAGVPVGQPTAISASETTTPASCFNGTDGTVTVSVSGGTSPYSVTVNGVTHTGVTSSTTFTGLAAGSYSASISDMAGCPGSAAGVPVGQPTAISASETTTPASCFNGADGTVTVSVSGGTSPYSVTVNGVTHTGVTSSTTFTGLAAGSYSASISDMAGCPGTAAGVPVGQPSAITASETTTPASCNASDGTVTVSVSGGTSPYSVTLNGVTHTGVTSSTTFTGLAAGTYGASITDKNGCPGSATGVPVGQQTCPCTTTSSITSNFNGTSINPSNYIWFNANFNASGIQNGTTISFTNSTISIVNGGNTYTVNVPSSTITFSSSATCASTTFSGGQWVTTVPVSGSDEIFLSGLLIKESDITGSSTVDLKASTVTWTGNFSTNTSGLTVSWKWGAAVYSATSAVIGAANNGGNPNNLNVKATHSNACGVNNGDHAGTPETKKIQQSVIGGARGGGGSNFTGSWSGTQSVTPCVTTPGAGGASTSMSSLESSLAAATNISSMSIGPTVCPPTGGLKTLIMTYEGRNGPSAGGTVNGNPNDRAAVYLVVTGGSPATTLFSGAVSFNSRIDPNSAYFVIDAGSAAKLPGQMTATIYAAQGGATVETVTFNGSCTQPLNIGDYFGSLRVSGGSP